MPAYPNGCHPGAVFAVSISNSSSLTRWTIVPEATFTTSRTLPK